MPRYTLKRLFFILTLLVVELGVLVPMAGPFEPRVRIHVTGTLLAIWVPFGLAIGGVVGAIILAPFKLALLGAAIGVFVNTLAMLVGAARGVLL
jgi:hypothetical protein